MTEGKVQLNNEQKRVVEHDGGPLLVVAGAGTGKTHVIVEHINKLLKEGISPKQILAVTFTEKAAAEMMDRVLTRHGSYELELSIMTFNAFGESLLREFSADIGLSRNFILLGENAQLVFLRERIDQLGLDYFAPIANPDGLLDDIATYFSKLKQHAVTPETYTKFVSTMPSRDPAEKLDKTKHKELASAFDRYIRLCREANVIDYDDQIYLVLELLKQRPNIQKELQNRYHTIMIDEFQDTNPMQSQLVDVLIGKTRNLIVVGDDDQSIYGFRGATLANILEFKDRYPDAEEVALIENYRSGEAILDASYQLIQHNNPHRLEPRLGINKKLKGQIVGKPPSIKHFASLDTELYWLAHDIKQKLEHGASPGSIAILARRNTTARRIDEALSLAGVPHIVVGQRYDLYQAPIIRQIVEALRTITDPGGNLSLHHTLTGPLFNIDNALLASIAAKTRREHDGLEYEIMRLKDSDFAAAQKAIEQIREWRKSAPLISVRDLVYNILTDSGYKNKLYARATNEPEAETAVIRLSQFFATLKEFEQVALQPTALQYIESLPALQAAGESTEDDTLDLSGDMVNVLTIHKAKGLEWETVYIPDCTESSFPLRASPKGIQLPEKLAAQTTSEADEHMAEERRLMYVAATRAKTNLYLSFSDRHHTPTRRKPSRFLLEMFGEEHVTGTKVEPENVALAFDALNGSSQPSQKAKVPPTILKGKEVMLSVSQVVTFLRCPLDFYYCYVLGIPDEPSPGRDYGTMLHGAIEQINKGLLSGKVPTLNDLQSDLKQHWPRAGYMSKTQRERAIAMGLKTLERFYKQHVVDQKQVPQLVEAAFVLKLSDESLTIRGRFDAVFENDKSVEIRDYKTSGSVDTIEKAKSRVTGSDQLTLYAMAWQHMHDSLPDKLTLEFIDTGIEASVRKTQRGIDGMSRKLAEIARAIRAGEFNSGSRHDYCRHLLSN